MYNMSPSRSIDPSKKRRYGPLALPAGELRAHCVSVRLNDAELAKLDEQRGPIRMQRGEFLRCAALHKLPPSIPAVNQIAFQQLARSAGNLNQVARSINEAARGSPTPTPSVVEIAEMLDDFRRSLIGAYYVGGVDE